MPILLLGAGYAGAASGDSLDIWGWSLNPILFVLLLISVGFVVRRYIAFGRAKYLAHCEYWVLSSAVKLPDLTLAMENVVGNNPYPNAPIGAAEGLLFSDVRFKISIILAAKNARAFAIEGAAHREAFEAAKSAIRVQYTSESELTSKHHLQFCVHVADAIARLTGATYIFDVVADRLWPIEEFQAFLSKARSATAAEDHVTISELDSGGFSVKGLQKVGVPDLETLPIESDKALLGRQILDEYVARSWAAMSPATDPIEAYGDLFVLVRTPVKQALESTRILRKIAD